MSQLRLFTAMKKTRASWLTSILALASLVVLSAPMSAMADNEESKAKNPPATDDGAKAADENAKADESAKAGANGAAPAPGSAKELLEKLNKLKNERPLGETRELLRESTKKNRWAVAELADQVLAAKPDEETRQTAVKEKLVALVKLYQAGEERALDELLKLARHTKNDPSPEIATVARSILFQGRMRQVMRGNVTDAPALIEETKAALKANVDDAQTVQMALTLGQVLEGSDKTRDLAAKAYREFGEILATSKNPRISEFAEKFEGVIRRLDLVGKKIQIQGTLLDGEKFDPKTLRGKVVLVDFWATWCGPCVEELPNVQRNYKLYHDKGFEVVAVNLDDQKEEVKHFVEERKLTWPVLFGESETARGWNHPMANHYGVMAIPQAILVDQTGNVVTLNARGKALGEHLEKLLGKVEEEPAKESES